MWTPLVSKLQYQGHKPGVRGSWAMILISQAVLGITSKVSIISVLSFSMMTDNLKLPSLFAAWLFWMFHNKSHYMKALVGLIHDHHFSNLLVYIEKMNLCGSLCGLLEYFLCLLHDFSELFWINHIVTHDHHLSHLLVYMEKMNFCGSLCGLLEYFLEKNSSSD